jgi:hypothetical protein
MECLGTMRVNWISRNTRTASYPATARLDGYRYLNLLGSTAGERHRLYPVVRYLDRLTDALDGSGDFFRRLDGFADGRARCALLLLGRAD